MRRCSYLLPILLAFTSIGCPPAPHVDAPKRNEVQASEIPAPVEDFTLKNRIDAALEQVGKRDLLTTHAFWTVFHGILGSGLERTMLTDPDTRKQVNAIKYICDGGKIRGMQFLPTPDGLDVQLGPQFEGQGHQDQFIAEMAQWGMRPEQKFRVGSRDATFDDFIRHSKARASVTQNQELSWAIVIVGQFYGTDYSWTNNLGEQLRFEDVVRYELGQPMDTAACGGTHRLFGLTWAYHLHLKNGGKKEGVWRDVDAKVEDHKQLARKQRSPDGSLSTNYFKSPGHAPDNAQLRISTTGHIVEWLALAMTDDELKAPWMQEAVNSLAVMILNMADQGIESGGLYHATHGLRLYHDRVFGTPAPYLPLPPLSKR